MFNVRKIPFNETIFVQRILNNNKRIDFSFDKLLPFFVLEKVTPTLTTNN